MFTKGFVAGAVAAFALLGGTPAAAFVVNISGTQNGEQTGGADCNNACQGPLISPVQVTFAPGTYTIKDAYDPTAGLAPGALYDAWNFQAGNGDAWVWHWKALTDDGAQGSTINQSNYAAHILLDVDRLHPAESFPTEAQAAAYGAATQVPNLTFSTPTTVDFVVNDYYLPDNAGGVSLDVEQVAQVAPVPEPGEWAMIVAGLGIVGGVAHRRRPR